MALRAAAAAACGRAGRWRRAAAAAAGNGPRLAKLAKRPDNFEWSFRALPLRKRSQHPAPDVIFGLVCWRLWPCRGCLQHRNMDSNRSFLNPTCALDVEMGM